MPIQTGFSQGFAYPPCISSFCRPVIDARPEISLQPARVIMQDFTGVPAIVDPAAMHSA